MDELEIKVSREQMENGIQRWQIGLLALAVLLIAGYVFYFGLMLGQMPAKDAEKWGQFGDFVGGLLNPVVAFAAFYWLTQSVKIQKIELVESRKALVYAADAQADQVKNGHRSIQLAAATAIVNAYQERISKIEREILEIQGPEPKHQFLTIGRMPQLMNAPRLQQLNRELRELTEKRDSLIADMQQMMQWAQESFR